jgi:hypothetical protein
MKSGLWRGGRSRAKKKILGQFGELETLVRCVFDKEHLLDYLRHFVVFEDDDGLSKKIAAYHQFHAVRAPSHARASSSARPWLTNGPSSETRSVVVWVKRHTERFGRSSTDAVRRGISAPSKERNLALDEVSPRSRP